MLSLPQRVDHLAFGSLDPASLIPYVQVEECVWGRASAPVFLCKNNKASFWMFLSPQVATNVYHDQPPNNNTLAATTRYVHVQLL